MKVGDKVRVIAQQYPEMKSIGHIGEITKADGSDYKPYYLDNHLWYSDEELELVTNGLTYVEALETAISGKIVRYKVWPDNFTMRFTEGKFIIYLGKMACVSLEKWADCLTDKVTDKNWYIVKAEPKYTVGQTIQNKGNDIGIIRSVSTEGSEVIYDVTFNGRTTKEYKESELKEVTNG